LLRDQLAVEHVPVGRVVAESDMPQMRYEGDTLVVPVFEEVLVVQKQLLLKEEVRITRHRTEVRIPETVLLRSEQVTAERFDEGRKQ
jgi:stress response protein YsnF